MEIIGSNQEVVKLLQILFQISDEKTYSESKVKMLKRVSTHKLVNTRAAGTTTKTAAYAAVIRETLSQMLGC